MAGTLTRRQALAGGTLGVVAAGAGGLGLVRAGVLPGRYRLGRVMGACDVGVPPTTVAPGPTRFGSFASERRGRAVGYGVAWPPGAGPGARLPVCLLLHAAAGDHRAPFDRLRMQHHLAQAVGAEGVRPFALASADGGGSSWRPAADDDPFGMLLEELLPLLAGVGLRTGADTVGVLGFDFGLYRIQPTGATDYTAANPRPAAPDLVGGEVRVAAMNTLNFFLTLDYPTGDPLDNKCGPAQNQECRGADADQPSEFTRQRDKLLAALSGLGGDVIGLNELENTTGVDPLADPTKGIVAGLNAMLGAGTYAAITTGTIGTPASSARRMKPLRPPKSTW